MRIYSLAQLSNEEKENILNKHRTLYNGYRTIQPNVSNTQDLYVQDFANDKNGITVNNKGVVKNYTNVKINEGMFDNIFGDSPKKVETISYKGYSIDVWSVGDDILYGHPRKKTEDRPYTKKLLVYNDLNKLKRAIDSLNKEESGLDTGIEDWQNADEPMDMSGSAVPSFFPKPTKKIKNPDFKGFSVNEQKQVCGECGGMMAEGECMECGWRNEGEVEENYKDELIGDEPKWEREFGHEDLEDLTKKEPSKKPFRPKVDLGKSFEKLKDQILGKKDIDEEKSVCSECGGAMNEGECMECGYKMEGIYDVDDIDDSNEFDYVEEQMLSPKDQMNKAKEPYNFVSQGPMLSMEDADFEEMEPAFSEEDFIDSDEIDFEDLKNDEDFVDADQIDIEDVEETWDDVEDDVKEEFIKEKNKISEMFYRINKFN